MRARAGGGPFAIYAWLCNFRYWPMRAVTVRIVLLPQVENTSISCNICGKREEAYFFLGPDADNELKDYIFIF